MRLLLIIPLAASLACLRENPAFDGSVALSGSMGSTSSTDPTTTLMPDATSSSGTTGAGTASTTGAADTSTTEPAVETTGTGTGTTGDGTSTTGGTTNEATGTGTGTSEASTGEASTGEPFEFPPEATLCGKPGPWVLSEPQLLGTPVNYPEGDLDMWLSYNGLILLWSSYREGAQDTYRATRAAVGMPFEGAYANNKDIGLSTPGEDGKLALSKVDTRAYLSTKLPGDMNYRIHIADRNGKIYMPWTPLALDFPDHPEAFDPHISVDDLRLYYAPAGDGQQLAVAIRPGMDQPFGAPSAAPFVSLEEPDHDAADPTLPAHELVLIYTRTAALEQGGHDLWFATRATIEAPFGPPQPLPTVNSPTHDASAHLSRDGCELFFARSTVQDPGAWDIYRSEIQ